MFREIKLIMAKDITDALAEEILKKYMIEFIDRRGNKDRRSRIERRNSNYSLWNFSKLN